jgi:hypothetical protein
MSCELFVSVVRTRRRNKFHTLFPLNHKNGSRQLLTGGFVIASGET